MKTAVEEGVKKLYHYQGANLQHLRDTLVNRRVHFSNPKNFNDPWDCNPYFEPAIDDPESRRKWGTRLDGFYKNLPGPLRAKLEAQWHGNWWDNTELLRRTIDQLTSWVRRLTMERWRIYCLTPHGDSVLMWAHYAEKHTGICLELDATIEQVGRALCVSYQDSFPILGPDDFNDTKALLDAVLLTKSNEWAYEDEYRMMARDAGVDPSFPLTTARDFLSLMPDVLTGIVAGCNADIGAIQALVDECRPDIPVKRAVRRPNQYHLDIVDTASLRR